MSTPTSPHGPVDRAQMMAVASTEETFPYEFRDQLESIDTGLTDSEREGERLAKKLRKRLSGDRSDLTSPSEYFLDKLTKWHSNKKVEKLKSLLAVHLPRVKHLEEDVVHSVASVHEHKEVVLHQAQLLLGLVDKQIDYYQHHLNFLDDVINDIRQCDYAVVKEVADMKTAFAFCQELEGRPRNNSRSTSTPHNPCTILLKIGTDSKGHVPGRRVLEDDAVALGRLSPALAGKTSDACDVLPEESVMVQLPRSVRRENLTPKKPIPGGGGSPPPGPAAVSSAAVAVEGESRANIDTRGDGADYKRKCLKSGAINLQLLNLQKGGTISGNSPTSSPPVYADASSELKKAPSMSPSNFMRAVGDRLSELTQFQKPSPVQKKVIEKQRSWSVSNAYSSDSPRLGDTEPDRAQFGKSVSLQDSMLSNGKNRIARSPSVGSMFFPNSTASDSAAYGGGGKTAGSGAPAQLQHSATPRPFSTGHDAHLAPHPVHPHSIPALPAPHAHTHDAPHKVEGGIAFESSAEDGAVAAHPQRTSSPPLHDASGLGSKSHSGQLSTSSSCSSFSQASASHAGDGTTERRRPKYSALLNHYPNLYQCVLTQASEPGVKLMARKMNKCLMFKDELKRSLVKAELVQETETSCLSKMRKVQHELQDMMEMDAAQHGSHPGNVSVLLRTPPTPLSPRQPGLITGASAGSGNSLLSAMSVEQPTGASSLGSESAASGSVHSPGKTTVAHALMGRLSHASEHDLSSTDDEHDHRSASIESSSQSRDNSFTLNDAATSSSRPVSGASAGLEQSALIEHLERIPSDPTIIDPSQDAVVNQISADLFGMAHKCAQQLKMLLDEEHEAVEKLQRVRHLLSSADFINEQLTTTLSRSNVGSTAPRREAVPRR